MTFTEFNLREAAPWLPGTITEPLLQCWLHANFEKIDPERRYPAVLICPGGGYEYTSDREAEPVALRFFAEGYNVFVLRYSCAPSRYPAQLLQAAAAVDYIRREEGCLCDGRLFVCGFSAGGHLACSVSVFWDDERIQGMLKGSPGNRRPDGMILCYPVISSGEYSHAGSFENLLGASPPQGLFQKMSLESAVDGSTPPAFIWHTADDPVVPVQNALLLAESLAEKNIPFALHVFQSGCHGLSMCDMSTACPGRPDMISPNCAQWFPLAINWLKCL